MAATVCVVAVLLVLITAAPFALATVSCKTCQSPPSDDILICKCDDLCSVYGDCCPDAQQSFVPEISNSLASAVGYMECKTRYVMPTLLPIAVGDAYYMVASCPSNWTTTDVRSTENIAKNCSNSIDLEFREIPPISDAASGITYRNEFCAICHNVDLSQALVWPTRLLCNAGFENATRTAENITLDLIRSFCSVCSFEAPSVNVVMDRLRWCLPVESVCPRYMSTSGYNETEYSSIVDSCINGPDYNPIHNSHQFLPPGVLYDTIYRNLDCVRCNGVEDFLLDCLYPSNSSNDTDSDRRCTDLDERLIIGGLPFSAILDISGSGVVRLTSSQITEIEVVTCEDTQLFDPVLGCRDIVCPVGYIPVARVCSPMETPPTDDSFTVGSGNNVTDTSNTTDNAEVPSYPNATLSCTSIALSARDEYILINSSFVLFRQEIVDVVGYDASGQPIICVNFNQSGEVVTNTSVVTLVTYPPGFIELTYIGGALSIIASILILITYSVFKQLRTLPSKLLMNLAIAFLLSDAFLILSGSISQIIESKDLCTVVSIVLHFFFLSRFSWMNCIGIEYTRTFIQAAKLRSGGKSPKSNNKRLLGYVVAGWGTPLLITVVTVVVNFTVDGAVRYGTDTSGEQGLCWINERIAAIVAFIVPISLSTLVNITLFVTVTVLICVAARSSSEELRRQQRSIQVRVILAIFSVLGLTWLFGFMALLSSLSWAWYPFIVLNSNQAVLVAVCFIATKKILLLYGSLFHCTCSRNSLSTMSSSKSKTVQIMASADSLSVVDKK